MHFEIKMHLSVRKCLPVVSQHDPRPRCSHALTVDLMQRQAQNHRLVAALGLDTDQEGRDRGLGEVEDRARDGRLDRGEGAGWRRMVKPEAEVPNAFARQPPGRVPDPSIVSNSSRCLIEQPAIGPITVPQPSSRPKSIGASACNA